MGDAIIRLDHITKIYKLYQRPQDRFKETFSLTHKKYSKDFYALRDISFAIERGESVGFVGKNGSGKSTLLKILTGVLSATSGNKAIHGKISALLELGAGFNMEFTGLENIYLNGTIMNIPREEMEKKLDDIIRFADIGDFIYQPVKTYSSGMFVRLAFAVAIHVDPEILIVDEALAVGDTRFQLKCMDKFMEFMNAGKTILFVSHDINMIKRFCKRVIWINEGELVLDGETDSVADKYNDFLKSGLSLAEYQKMTQIEEVEEKAEEVELEKREEELLTLKEEQREEQIEIIENQVTKEVPNAENGIAEINKIRMFQKDGTEITQISQGEDVILEISYTVYEEQIEEPVLGIAIRSIDHTYICGLNTLLDEQTISWKKGKNTIKLVYERFNLTGGNYYFDAALFDRTATVHFDYQSQVKKFFVKMDYIAEGVVVLNHHWEQVK